MLRVLVRTLRTALSAQPAMLSGGSAVPDPDTFTAGTFTMLRVATIMSGVLHGLSTSRKVSLPGDSENRYGPSVAS